MVNTRVYIHISCICKTTCTCSVMHACCVHAVRLSLHLHIHVHTSSLLCTESLNRVIREVCYDGVCSLYHEWGRVVMGNARYILEGVVKGVAYLHDNMCIQHVDLKGKLHIHVFIYMNENTSGNCTALYMHMYTVYVQYLCMYYYIYIFTFTCSQQCPHQASV